MKRYAFVDWYRGLACVLMFQTHAYGSWVAGPYRDTPFFAASQYLGGFPARLFLMLAGVSLMLRMDGDRRRGVPVRQAQNAAAMRGLEVLGLGLLFRLTEWVLGLPSLRYLDHILQVDILNCIGASLVLSSYLVSPRDLEQGRVPWRPALLALVMVFVTPAVQRYAHLPWPPRFPTSYVAGPKPMAAFPLFPWMAYTLTGCVAGAYWIRAIREGRGPQAMWLTAGLGAVMAIAGQVANRSPISLYHFGPLSNVLTSPVAYFFRTGVCLLGAALAYAVTAWLPETAVETKKDTKVATKKDTRVRLFPLRQLGRTSLLVYWVHVELVYGHLSDPIKGRLGIASASVLLVLLTGLMLALSYWRTERYGKRAAVAAPAIAMGHD